MDLVQFFDGISNTVKVIVEQAVGTFLETIEGSVSEDPEKQALAKLRVGPYKLTDLQCTVGLVPCLFPSTRIGSSRIFSAHLQKRPLCGCLLFRV